METKSNMKEKLANARNLKANGVPVDVIAKSLGIDVEEVIALWKITKTSSYKFLF